MSEKNEKMIERDMKKCRHFNGVMNECCRAGIAYKSVTVFHLPPGTGASMPCLLSTAEVPCQCEKASYPTREEAEQSEADWRQRRIDTAKARAAILAATKGAKRVRGRILCPVCEKAGSLRFGVAYNGHIHAQCETEGCVAWIE